jgi:hypothetical protein
MPVHLSEQNGKYCVVEPNGTVKKCYGSKAEALAYLKAINMHIKKGKGENQHPNLAIAAGELVVGQHLAPAIQIVSDGTSEGTIVMLNGVSVPFNNMDFSCCASEDYPYCSMSITVRDIDEAGTSVSRTFNLRNSPPPDQPKSSGKLDPNAGIRNRGDVVFPANSKKVKDKKDHFPINNPDQARNALSRVAQYSSVPSWYAGSLSELQAAVRGAVSRKYKGIKVTK